MRGIQKLKYRVDVYQGGAVVKSWDETKYGPEGLTLDFIEKATNKMVRKKDPTKSVKLVQL